MEGEKYQPTPEEIKQAEETMTDEQKMQSESRAEGFVLGQQTEKNKNKKEKTSSIKTVGASDNDTGRHSVVPRDIDNDYY